MTEDNEVEIKVAAEIQGTPTVHVPKEEEEKKDLSPRVEETTAAIESKPLVENSNNEVQVKEEDEKKAEEQQPVEAISDAAPIVEPLLSQEEDEEEEEEEDEEPTKPLVIENPFLETLTEKTNGFNDTEPKKDEEPLDVEETTHDNFGDTNGVSEKQKESSVDQPSTPESVNKTKQSLFGDEDDSFFVSSTPKKVEEPEQQRPSVPETVTTTPTKTNTPSKKDSLFGDDPLSESPFLVPDTGFMSFLNDATNK